MKNKFFPLSDVSTRAAVVFKYAGVEQIKHRLMEEANEKWKSAQKQNRAKLHESKHKLTFTKTKLSAEWQRRINRERKNLRVSSQNECFWVQMTILYLHYCAIYPPQVVLQKETKKECVYWSGRETTEIVCSILSVYLHNQMHNQKAIQKNKT